MDTLTPIQDCISNMTYPDIVPSGSVPDSFGVSCPDSWAKQYLWRDKDGKKEYTTAPTIKGKSWDFLDGALLIPGINRAYNASLLGPYSGTLLTQYCIMFQKHLAYLYKLAGGLEFGFWDNTVLYGEESTNWADKITVWGSVEGKVLTIVNAQPEYSNPRDFEITLGRYSIRPGMAVVAVGSNCFAWIKEGIQFNELTTVCQLTHTLPQSTTEFKIWDTFGAPEVWDYINPGKWLWSARDSQTFPYMGEESWCELAGLDGEHCAIAYPMAYADSGQYIGTFKVEATHADGSVTDETEYYLTDFPGASAKVKIEWDSTNLFRSWINLDKVDATISFWTITCCPGTDPLTHTDRTDIDMRTMIGCSHLILDMGSSLGSAAPAIDWVCKDSDGNHYYCDQHALGADVSQLNGACMNTCCPKFDFIGNDRATDDVVHGGWMPTHAFWRDLFLAHNIYTYTIQGALLDHYAARGTGGHPSIWWLAGAMRNFAYDGLPTPRLSYVYAGLLGYLDKSTTPFYTCVRGDPGVVDLLEPDGWIPTQTYLGMSVIEKAFDNGATENGDLAGGDLTDSTGMRLQYKTMPGMKGMVSKPIIPTSDSAGAAGSYQRVIPKRFTLQGIQVGDALIDTPQTFPAGHTATVRTGNVLEVKLVRTLSVTPADTIQQAAKYIDSVTVLSPKVASLHMQPGLEDAFYLNDDGDVEMQQYVVAGQTVDPPDAARDSNYAASDASSAQGFTGKVRKGLALRIVGAPTVEGVDLSAICLTVLASQAFKGSAFTGNVPSGADPGVTLSTQALGLGHPQYLESFRLLMDEVVIEDDTGLVVAWLDSAGPLPQESYSIELIDGVDQPVLPPAYKIVSGGGVADTDYPLELYHMETFEGAEVSITPTSLDRTSGTILIDITGWSKTLDHYLYIKGSFLESLSMVSSYMLTDIKRAIETLTCFKSSMGVGVLKYLAAIYVHPPIGEDYSTGLNWALPEGIADGTYSLSNLLPWATGTLTDCFTEYDSDYGNTVISAIFYPEIGIPPHDLLAAAAWALKLQSFRAPQTLMGIPELISEAYLEVTLVNATKTVYHTGEEPVVSDVATSDIKFQAIALEPFAELSGKSYYKASLLGDSLGAVVGEPVTTIEDGKVVKRFMLNVTTCLKGLCSQPQSASVTHLFSLVGNGVPLVGSTGFNSLLGNLFETFSITVTDGVVSAYEFKHVTITAESCTFGNLYISLDQDKVAEYAPAVVPGLYPALV